jgi:hypothetical protein
VTDLDSYGLTISSATANGTLVRVFCEVLGQKVELTSFKGGEIEVYVIDRADGIPMFRGYLAELKSWTPNLRSRLRDAWTQGRDQAIRANVEAWKQKRAA